MKEANLTVEDPKKNNTPGIREYPLMVECRILYGQDQNLSKNSEDIQERMYPQNVPGTNLMANRDCYTMYVGQIMDAYKIR